MAARRGGPIVRIQAIEEVLMGLAEDLKALQEPRDKCKLSESAFGPVVDLHPAANGAFGVMSKNPPDWWARTFGMLGILIALGGLAATYFNNRWQQQVYAKSEEERIFVQLNAEYTSLSSNWSEETKPSQAQLAVEIVNLGMQPMYLKSITGEVADHRASFYEHDPLNAKEPLRRLEPGEAADYVTDWQWPLEDLEDTGKEKGRGMEGTVEVETTKKRFTQSAYISNRVTISADVVEQLLRLMPGKTDVVEPPELVPHKKLPRHKSARRLLRRSP